MRIACFDCFSGISGDMCLGAVVDAGVPLERIAKQLRALRLGRYRIVSRRVKRAGLSATKVDVLLPAGSPQARTWQDVRSLIDSSRLSEKLKKQGTAVFRRLFEAEARVHGTSLNRAHLHELGAVDCFVDVFGTLIGLEELGVEAVHVSPINLGSGTVMTEHGSLPVPAPATAELMQKAPVYASGPQCELTTPTGAAIATGLAGSFGPLPFLRCERIGYGAGGRDFPGHPNVLRLMVGTTDGADSAGTVTVIETNIDDMNPQAYEHVVERLFGEGALDVFLTQIVMKKTRPAVKLTVLAENAGRDRLIRVLLEETTTIGVRFYEAGRVTMEREFSEVITRYGSVKTKVAEWGGIVKEAPEYESCVSLARKRRVPVLRVLDEAKKAAKTGKKKRS